MRVVVCRTSDGELCVRVGEITVTDGRGDSPNHGGRDERRVRRVPATGRDSVAPGRGTPDGSRVRHGKVRGRKEHPRGDAGVHRERSQAHRGGRTGRACALAGHGQLQAGVQGGTGDNRAHGRQTPAYHPRGRNRTRRHRGPQLPDRRRSRYRSRSRRRTRGGDVDAAGSRTAESRLSRRVRPGSGYPRHGPRRRRGCRRAPAPDRQDALADIRERSGVRRVSRVGVAERRDDHPGHRRR